MKDKASKKSARTPTPRKRKPSDEEQYERFRQATRDMGTDESEEAFDQAFRKIVPPRSS